MICPVDIMVSIFMTVVGSIHFFNTTCPGSSADLFLMIGGSCYFVLGVARYMACHYGPKYFVDEDEFGDQVKYYGGAGIVSIELICYLGLLVWGTITVVVQDAETVKHERFTTTEFPSFTTTQEGEEPPEIRARTPTYCDEVTFKFAYGMVIFGNIVFGIILLFLVCGCLAWFSGTMSDDFDDEEDGDDFEVQHVVIQRQGSWNSSSGNNTPRIMLNNQGQMIQVQRQPQVVIQRPQQQPMFIQGGVQMQQVKIQPGGTIIRTPNGQVIKIGGGSGTGTPRSMTPSPQGSPFKIKVQPASDPATPTKTTISGKALFPGPQKMDFADTVQAARLQAQRDQTKQEHEEIKRATEAVPDSAGGRRKRLSRNKVKQNFERMAFLYQKHFNSKPPGVPRPTTGEVDTEAPTYNIS